VYVAYGLACLWEIPFVNDKRTYKNIDDLTIWFFLYVYTKGGGVCVEMERVGKGYWDIFILLLLYKNKDPPLFFVIHSSIDTSQNELFHYDFLAFEM
jgi:hypothetical protein